MLVFTAWILDEVVCELEWLKMRPYHLHYYTLKDFCKAEYTKTHCSEVPTAMVLTQQTLFIVYMTYAYQSSR